MAVLNNFYGDGTYYYINMLLQSYQTYNMHNLFQVLNGMMLHVTMKNQLYVKILKDIWILPDKLSLISEYLKSIIIIFSDAASENITTPSVGNDAGVRLSYVQTRHQQSLLTPSMGYYLFSCIFSQHDLFKAILFSFLHKK